MPVNEWHLIGIGSATKQAGSLGAEGSQVSLGIRNIQSPARLDSSKGGQNKAEYFSLAKGTPLPIDFHFSFSRLDHDITKSMGSVKWTILEGFRLPALAIAGNYARVWGVEKLSTQNLSADLVVGYAFNRYISFDFATKVSWQFTSIEDFDDIENEKVKKEDRRELRGFSGLLSLRVLPPFVTVAFQAEHFADKGSAFVLAIVLGS